MKTALVLLCALCLWDLTTAATSKRGTVLRDVSSDEEPMLVDAHNAKRREVQSSEVGNAANMQLMYWNDELAVLAQEWADNCVWEHRDSPTIDGLPGVTVGENMGQNSPTKDWGAIIDSWYSEIQNFSYGAVKGKQPGVDEDHGVGHFSQVVHAESGQVGCGYALCNWNAVDTHFYVCNYALGQRNYNTPYTQSETSCSACSSNCVDQLCNCVGKVCANGGTLKVGTDPCTCDCPPRVEGDICQTLSGCSSDDPSYCGVDQPYGYPVSYCGIPNVDVECPIMCNKC